MNLITTNCRSGKLRCPDKGAAPLYRYAQNNVQLYEQMRRTGHGDEDLRHLATAYDFALKLFAGRYRGSGKPFLDHLVGTASVLVQHGAALPTVLAGLMHAAYRHAEWGTGRRGITQARRDGLSAVIGREAEALVFRYDTFDWDRLKREPIPEVIAGMDEIGRQATLMHLANDLEESVDRALLYCGPEILDEHVEWLPYWAETAKAMGLPEIAEELQAALRDTTAGAPPEYLPGQRRWPHTLAPLSHSMRFLYFLLRVANAVQRRLPGAAGAPVNLVGHRHRHRP